MKPILKTSLPYFFCLSTLLLIIFYYHIDKHLYGTAFVILTLLIPLGVTVILTYLIEGIVAIIKDFSGICRKSALTTLVCLTTLCYIFLSPYRLSSERLESDVVTRACYEGTQNQATLKFRRDRSFELHWTGVFFANTWYIGTWEQKGDVLYLKYSTEKCQRLGDTLLIKDGYLYNIGGLRNERKRPMFYLGYCRHEN